MRLHPRIRKVVKWGGLLLIAALFGILWFTSQVGVGYVSPFRYWFFIAEGQVWLGRADPRAQYDLDLGWHLEPQYDGLKWGFSEVFSRFGRGVCVPQWLPIGLATCAVVLAWRFDTLARRREKMLACPSCGYSRTGLAPSSPCPECGTAHAAAAPPSATSMARR